MDLIISPIAEFLTKYVIDSIGAMFQVSRNLEDDITELKRARDSLVARRDGQRRKLEEAKMQEGVEASPEANHWFSQVEENASSVDNLLLEYEESRAQCRICFCSSSYQLSKRASKLKQVIDILYKDDLKSDWTAAPVAQKGRNMDTIPIEGQTTTEKLMHEIIDAVLDNRYIVVGLHGKGGIGKTTLLRHTNEYFRKTEDFESVIFTTVSATPNFVEIRKQIAESLGLKNCQDDNDLKEKLCRLLETRRYLLILDDMWEPVINLGEICIHVPKKNGCKILMASRSMSVLTKLVIKFAAKDSLQLIPVNNLPPDEAWDLFVQKVGKEITSKPTVEPIAKKVLRKCGGLPLANVAIGGTMSTRETEGEWKDALRELEHSASTVEGMEEVFSILMFSFEKLEQIQQALFLYCCLFPENYTIPKQSLVNFAIGEETMYGSCGMHQLGDMRNKVEVWVGKLRNSSMLEDDGFEGIKMHDMMRELGVWITSPTSNKYHSKFIAKARARITEAPHASEWRKATKISLMQNEIQSLPQLQQCPQLHTLLLQQTRVKDIPQMHFLEHMPALRILDLSFTGIRNLPPSISHLVNLRLLCLMKCYNLQQLPSEIGMLVQLISLNFFDCGSLRELPLEMKRLNNLRNLDIGWTGKLKRIPCGVLSGLHKLEELNTFLSGIKWYTNGLEELSRLKCLTSISIGEITKVEVSHWFNPLASFYSSGHKDGCFFFFLRLYTLMSPSGKHLSELCRAEYPKYVKYCLWLLAELSVIAADIPEVVGTAFAINILFPVIPVWGGVIFTGFSTLILLGLQKYGDACRFFMIESGLALFVAFLINLSMVAVLGTACNATNISPVDAERCSNLTLNSVSFLLQNVLGKSSSIIYAVALLASGQSSSITGTYAGQFIMQGFLDLKMKNWIRNLMTRFVAIAPSLIISIILGPSGAGQLIIVASMILAFELPFAMIPLLKFSSSTSKMGPHKNSIYSTHGCKCVHWDHCGSFHGHLCCCCSLLSFPKGYDRDIHKLSKARF